MHRWYQQYSLVVERKPNLTIESVWLSFLIMLAFFLFHRISLIRYRFVYDYLVVYVFYTGYFCDVYTLEVLFFQSRR